MKDNIQTMSEPLAAEPAVELAFPVEESKTKAKNRLPKKQGFWADQWHRVKKHWKLLLFLIPAALVSFVFSYIPMFGILFAFKSSADFNLVKNPDVIFNLIHGGWTFENFSRIFYDSSFINAVANTLIINVLRLGICFPLSIVIAVMLSELKNQTLAKVILIIITIPNFLSWAIVIGIWAGFLDPDFGVLGRITGFIMRENAWFKPLVVFFSAWKSAGWGCILYYSAIASIDKTYYESATLEGANRLQKMWYLTIPSILPTIALTLVLNISGMMATGFEQIYTMMQVNPGTLKESQIVLDTYIYEISILFQNDVPFATALGVFNGLIGLTLMIVGNTITSKTLKRGLW